MAALALRKDEGVGLALAVAAHIALVAVLVLRPLSKPVVLPPERMTVTISDEVGLTSTSPEPAAQSAPDVAPDLGEPAPPEPEPAPSTPQARPEPPKPQPPKPSPPKPIVRPMPPPPAPRPIARPAPPRPIPKAAPAPRPAAPKAQPRPAAQPARSAQPSRTQAAPQPRPAGASRIGSDFLNGAPTRQNTGASRNPPAAQIGPAVQASLRAAVSRQLKPHWTAPQGADAELLVTLVRFRLARDGSLIGQPEVIGQSGETPANAAQKARHAEQAIRAVRLAAPFDLPDEFYSAWQTVTSRFDRRLSQ